MTVVIEKVTEEDVYWPHARPERRFYLGTHIANWLGRKDINVPLFVSHRTLVKRRSLPRAVENWACDSGAFTELNRCGADAFKEATKPYIKSLYRYKDEIGKLVFAAPQDWMCEPFVLSRTGLTVEEHQRRTVDNFLELRELAPDLPIIPVLQGYLLDDYYRCCDLYGNAGVDLSNRLVGLGSVCRRQSSVQIEELVTSLWTSGVKNLHGFGVKIAGLARYGKYLTSTDSMAWSFAARNALPLLECAHGNTGRGNCANCHFYAILWRRKLLAGLEEWS